MSRSDFLNSLTAKRLRMLSAIWLFLLIRPSAFFGQCTLTCNDGLQISLDAAGQALVTTDLIAPSASVTCPGALQLKLFTPQGILIPNNTLNCSHIGMTVTAQVKHLASGNSCTGTLEVRDGLPPALSCPEKFIFCNQNASPEAVGFPSMTDNCTPSNNLAFNYFDDVASFPCGTLQGGIPVTKRIDRSWFVSDAYGNTSACVQKVWLKHITLPAVVFPPNLDGLVNPSLHCGQDPGDLSITGQPAIAGIPIDNSPDCEFGVTYNDQVIDICPPAGFSVLRTWTAVDFCTGAISNRLQIIKVEDKTPPAIVPPGDITVGTDGFLCTGTVTLPQPATSDDCSAVSVAASWVYGTGFGPFTGVGKGPHTVTYTATDGCGNTSTANLVVTVEDTSPPQAICSSGIQVSLSANGIGFVNAGALDQGSFDNCGTVALSVSRDDSLFLPMIEVSCADIGTALPLTLRVTDAVGLENLCVTEVNVRDFLKPTLVCPPGIALTCLQDYHDLSLTGQATASDNCGLQSVDFEDFTNTGACNTGSVLRVWKATDNSGNAKSCVQQIVLNPVSNISVVFPPDATVNACADPGSTLPPATGQPVISGQYCSPLSVTYSDEIFPNAPFPYCRTIFRAWKVIDFCVYDPNNDTSGVWKHTQIINVADDQPPALVIPYDITVGADSSGCTAAVTLPPAVATDCGDAAISNDSPFAANTGDNASGVYPLGVHSVVFTASDNCGNVSQQTLTITVRDLTAPSAVCRSDLSVSLDTAGLATIGSALIDGGSSDNCTAPDELTFQVSSAEFNCQSIGIQQVMLTVTDLSGNTSTCTAAVSVIDPSGACLPPPPPAFSIEGLIRTPQGAPVANIPVFLKGDGFSAVAESDSAGHYIFDAVPGANVYTLRPANNANWLNGVSTFDLVLISKHILGFNPFDTPYKRIAADANHSNAITTFDIVQLRKVILGISDTIAGNTSWRFLDAAYTFSDPSDPFAGVFPEQIQVSGPVADLTGQDFTGMKTGDLNNSVDPAQARSVSDTLFLTVPRRTLRAGQTTLLPVYLKNWQQLEGFQFELSFDTARMTLEKIVFARPDLLDDSKTAVKPDGKLAVSWDNAAGENAPAGDSAVFFVQLTAKTNVDARAAAHLAQTRIPSEAYDNQSVMALSLRTGSERHAPAEALELRAVYPNPFCGEVVVPFVSPEAGDMILRVEDASGRIATEKKASAAEGPNEWVVRQSELHGPGVYYFHLIPASGAPAGGRFILLCD